MRDSADTRMIDQLAAAPEVPGEITFSDLFDIVRGSYVAIIVCTLVGVGVAAFIAWYTTPVYQATMLLSPAGGETSGRSALSRLAGQFAPLAGLVGGDNGTGLDGRDVWIATLKSRRLAEVFMVQHNLLPVLFPKRWDATARQWKVRSGQSLEPSMDLAYAVFSEDVLSVSEDRRTGLVTVEMESTDRAAVARWANDFVAQANEMIRTRAINESQQSLEYLKRELEKTNVAELERVLYSLIESKISQGMLANVRKEYAFVVIDPAVTPEPESFVRPRRVVIVAVGLLLGLLGGFVYASVKWIRRVDAAAGAR